MHDESVQRRRMGRPCTDVCGVVVALVLDELEVAFKRPVNPFHVSDRAWLWARERVEWFSGLPKAITDVAAGGCGVSEDPDEARATERNPQLPKLTESGRLRRGWRRRSDQDRVP